MDIPKQIQESIIQNKLVIFAGSGLSLKFNLPTWDKLVIDVINDVGKDNYKTLIPVLENKIMSAIEVLEKIKVEHYSIKKYIQNNFNITKGDFSLHEKLIDLTGQIITTNYDNAFEKASSEKIVPSVYTSQYNVGEIDKTSHPYIFKLHGSFVEPDKCVVFKEQYEEIYSTESAAKEKLKSIFINKTILFIGFSFSDPDINLIFENLDKAFGNNTRHYILTTDKKEFMKFKFLEPIAIPDYSDSMNSFIDSCLKFKKENKSELLTHSQSKVNEGTRPIKQENELKIAFLYPNTLDIDFKDEFLKVLNCFDSLDTTLFVGALNTKTLLRIDEFNLLIIVSRVFKSKIYIEDDNLKSSLLEPEEICNCIPNEKIPIVFITNEKITPIKNFPSIYISSYKNQIINKFIYKTLKCNELNFKEDEIYVQLKKNPNHIIKKGKTITTSLYGNNKNLDIGKKCLTNVVGRVEEQATIALKIINIIKSNKLLNIKASGGTGKTTLIKKVAYELYNRGYFKDGVNFKSCESIKTFADFEETLIEGFNLNNILNFKDHLVENYPNSKIDLLIILDNFETVVNNLSKSDLELVVDLLKFSTDYANIVVTSREQISTNDDFEDVYSLTPLVTDDALALFQQIYGVIKNEDEIRILRNDVLEDLLNNNPLAIKLVLNTRTKFRHIIELKELLTEHFFESTNEDYTNVFKNKADLNIERTKSIYHSINYSYTTLTSKEKIAFELLSLFPDGISLSNFKKCFEKKSSSNKISDKELKTLKDKSLLEDYNGILQLQPIIRRFAEYQFSKRNKELRQKYCLDAYVFNCYILDFIKLVQKKKSTSEAFKVYVNFKNNLITVLSYILDIELNEKGPVPEKKYLLNFIYFVEEYFINEKQITEFINKILQLKSFFSDLDNAEIFIDVLVSNKKYYHKEFDSSYKRMNKYLTVEQMENRIFETEDYLENRYKNTVANIHSMEGFTLQYINSFIKNNDTDFYLDAHFFYLGIQNNISRKKDGFYFFEYELILDRLNISQLENYISSLYMEEHLEIMQCTYTLSKVKKLDKPTIQKLVVTNPYTRGLKELMFAFNADSDKEKINHFTHAIDFLSHIKYYYLEALYYYCLFLKKANYDDFKIRLAEGLSLSKTYKYQYLNYMFNNINNDQRLNYSFSYDYYQVKELEDFVEKHNNKWEKIFKDYDSH